MIGAIAGDMIGSIYERRPPRSFDFPLFSPGSRFTDDSVMTVATADAVLGDRDFGAAYQRWGHRYPTAGYGAGFRIWLASNDPRPYNSFGNGAAMRVSPVAWFATSEADVLALAEATARPTHSHPRGIIGAQSAALAIWLARQQASRDDIRRRVVELSGYDLDRTVEQIRPDYYFDVTCDGSVPEAIICALESTDWEHAVRLAVTLGGDADTLGAIAGSIAEAMYGVPENVVEEVVGRLDRPMKEIVLKAKEHK